MDPSRADSSRCYVCGRTLEECREYLRSILDENVDQYLEELNAGDRSNSKIRSESAAAKLRDGSVTYDIFGNEYHLSKKKGADKLEKHGPSIKAELYESVESVKMDGAWYGSVAVSVCSVCKRMIVDLSHR